MSDLFKRVGSEFLVNTQTANYQVIPTITGLTNGGFLVSWADYSGTLGDASGISIKAQVFDASGAKVGGEFLVNTQTASDQYAPTITGLIGGGFVVSWHDASGTLGDSSGRSIKAQVFDASGAKVGDEFLVNTQTASDQLDSTITGLTNGGFVVSWFETSSTGDASGTSIRAQIFDATGARLGGEFLVNSQTANDQIAPTITELTDGGFVVSWFDLSGTLGDSSGHSIKAQVFSAGGAKVGSEFLVNTQTAASQLSPTIAGLTNGGFVVSWHDNSGTTGDSSGYSIKAQVFNASGAKVGSEFLVNTQTASSQQSPTIIGLANGGFVVSWGDTSGTLGDGSGASIKAQVFNASGAKVGGEFLVNTETVSNQFEPSITGLTNGGFVVSWYDFSGTLGDSSLASIKAQIFAPNWTYAAGSEILVNTQTSGEQSMPTITGLANGGLVVSWTDWNSGGDGNSSSIKAQVFDANGARVGGELLVNTQATDYQFDPTITGLANGNFVVSWTDQSRAAGDTSSASIRAQIYSAAGAKIGSEFVVNTVTGGNQIEPAMARLVNGGFVASWSDESGADGSGYGIKAQVFSASGAKVGSEVLVNTQSTGNQTASTITGLANGGFAVSWLDLDGVDTIKAQIFDATGARLGSELLVNTQTAGLQGLPTITGLSTGGFVVSWHDENPVGDGSVVSVQAQLFDASGVKIGGEFVVNTQTYLSQQAATITAVADGGFVVSWQDESMTLGDTSGSSIKAQQFDANGTKIGDEFLVNTQKVGSQYTPAITALADGGFAVSWTDTSVAQGDGSSSSIKVKLFSPVPINAAPVITSGSGETAAVNLPENTAPVTTVTATDADSGTLTYSLNGGADQSLFDINPTTGALSFKAAPNFEDPADADKNNVYDVVVKVSDGTASDQQAIAVTVTNVNEAPVLSFGTAPSAMPWGTTGTLVFTNPDADDAATPSIQLASVDSSVTLDAASLADIASDLKYGTLGQPSGSNPGVFHLAAGGVYVTGLQAGETATGHFLVTVTDKGGLTSNALSISATSLFGKNDAPVITSLAGGTNGDVFVAEGSTSVFTITSTDPDISATRTFSITGGADQSLFTIDASTGALGFLSAPNYENPSDGGADNTYDVVVRVTDDTALFDEQTLRVLVTNSDEAPTLTATPSNPTFTEDGPAVALFGSAAASTIETGQAFLAMSVTVSNVTDIGHEYLVFGGNYVVLVNGESGNAGPIAWSVSTVNDVATVSLTAAGGLSQTDFQSFVNGLSYVNQSQLPTDGNRVVTIADLRDSGSDTPPDDAVATLNLVSTVDVDPVNDSPVITLAASAASVEQVFAKLDPTGTVVDADLAARGASGNYDGAILLVRREGGEEGAGNSEDEFGFDTTGSGFTVAGVDGNELHVGGVSFAEFTMLSGTLQITFLDGATGAFVQSVLRAITYRNSSDEPPASVVIEVILSDGSPDHGQGTGQPGFGSDTITVTIEDTSDNEAPIAVDDTLTLYEDGGIVTVNLLSNDTDPDNDTLTASMTYAVPANTSGGFSNGSVQLSTSAGTYQQLTEGQVLGLGTTNYTVSDGKGGSDTGSLTVQIIGKNDAPVISSNGGNPTAAINVKENTTAVTKVVASDVDSGETPTYSIAGGADQARFTIDAATGDLSFVAAPNFEARTDSDNDGKYEVIVRASDATTHDDQAITVTITDFVDREQLSGPVYPLQGGNLFTSLGGNISRDGGNNRVYSNFNASQVDNIYWSPNALKTSMDGGSFTGAEDMTLTSISADGLTATWSGETRTPENLTVYTRFVATISSGVSGTARWVTGASLGYTSGDPLALVDVDESVGSVRLNLQFLASSSSGSGYDSFLDFYDINSISGGTAFANIDGKFYARVLNNAPTITSDGGNATASVNVAENGTAVTLVQATDADAGNTLTYSLSGGADKNLFQINASTGALSFVSAPDYESGTDANTDGVYEVTVSVSDGIATDTQAISVTVTNVNEAPDGNPESYSTAEDNPLVVLVPGVLGNDTDADGNPITAALEAGPTNGTLSLNPNGSFTYTPNANYNGPDSFTYKASNGTLTSPATTVTINVTAVDDAPAGTDKTVAILEDTDYTFAASDFGFGDANDSPADALLGVKISTLPGAGTLTNNGAAVTAGQLVFASDIADGLLKFTPAANANGAGYASFTFQVQDNGSTADGGQVTDQSANTFTVNVTAVNDTPVGVNDTGTAVEAGTAAGSNASGNVLANDTDADSGDTKAVSAVTGGTVGAAFNGAYGALTLRGDGGYTYVVDNANTTVNALRLFTDTLTETFTYTVRDTAGATATATLTVTIHGANDAPAGVTDTYTVPNNTSLVAAAAQGVLANDSDPDGNPLTATLLAGPTHGALTLNADGSFKYTPTATYSGTDSFTYKASDGTLQSGTTTVSLTVTESLTPPSGNTPGTTNGNDTYYQTDTYGPGTVNAGAGNDSVVVMRGDYTIRGGAGNDMILTGIGNDTITFLGAGDGFDAVNTGQGFDRIVALSDNTVIGLSAVLGVEEISAGGFANVTIQGDANPNAFNFAAVTLTGIVQISGGGGGDTIVGSAAADRIAGGLGADKLTGGGGADLFVYAGVDESGPGLFDRINDFLKGTDLIDLTAIDANTTLANDQAFSFIGSTGFSNTAGQLRADLSGNTATVYGDVNGDSQADFQLQVVLQGPAPFTPLQTANFIL